MSVLREFPSQEGKKPQILICLHQNRAAPLQMSDLKER